MMMMAIGQTVRGADKKLYQQLWKEFTNCFKHNNIAISMDRRGRAHDNIFIEKLWISEKYEEVYLKNYEIVEQAVKNHLTFFLTWILLCVIGIKTCGFQHIGGLFLSGTSSSHFLPSLMICSQRPHLALPEYQNLQHVRWNIHFRNNISKLWALREDVQQF